MSYCIDYYTNKALRIQDNRAIADLQIGQKIVIEQIGAKETHSLARYIGGNRGKDYRICRYIRTISVKEKNSLQLRNKKESALFALFKKIAKSHLPEAIPVTVRYHIFKDQLYLYFYGEQRFDFSSILPVLRRELEYNFFLYQIGARDMIQMSPRTDAIIGCNGQGLCCKSNRPLPSISIQALVEQQLEGRDIERLKGRCGKLKCSLLYELQTYIEEKKSFPSIGDTVSSSECEECGVVTQLHIMSRQIQIRTGKGQYVRLSLDTLQENYNKQKASNTAREGNKTSFKKEK